MNKRITSLLLCFVMLFSLMVTAVPAMAASNAQIKLVPNKTDVHPGDEVEYSLYIGPVTNMGALQCRLVIPAGLTFVTGSGTMAPNMSTILDADNPRFVEIATATGEQILQFVTDDCGSLRDGGYTSTEDTLLMTFKCSVNDGVSGTIPAVGLNVIEFYLQDDDLTDIDYDIVSPTLNSTIPHTHDLTLVPADPATCTTDGNKAYYTCSGCTDWFEDATGNAKIADHDSVIIPATGHDYSERILDDAHKKDTATDCRTKDTYWFDCSRCDQNAKDDTAATDKWFESDNAGPHAYDTSTWGYKGTDGHAHKCLYDDAHDTPVAHNPGPAATEDTPQLCTDCDYVIHDALGHTHSTRLVPETAATCTTDGNKAYYVCDGCGEWFEDATGNVKIDNHDSVILHALDHDWEPASCTAPKTCKRPNCGATEGNKLPHTPDRDKPTVYDPVKCKECGEILEPKLESAKFEIPFTVTVKQGSNVAPGKQTFELEVFDIKNSNEDSYKDVTVTAVVETNGNGNYDAKLVVFGPKDQVENFISEGFFVREKNTKAANWTYSDAVWFVRPNDTNDGYIINPTTLESTDNGDFYIYDRGVTLDNMTFENVYTENKTVVPVNPKTNEPSKTNESVNPEKTAKTNDGNNILLWSTVFLISGGAAVGTTVYSKKRKNVK